MLIQYQLKMLSHIGFFKVISLCQQINVILYHDIAWDLCLWSQYTMLWMSYNFAAISFMAVAEKKKYTSTTTIRCVSACLDLKYSTVLPFCVQVREVAAQLGRPLPSGQRSHSPKDTFVSSSFMLPQREKTDAEEGRDSGKTDNVGTFEEPWSWKLSAYMLAFLTLNSSSFRVSHSLILSYIVSLFLLFSTSHCKKWLFIGE